MSRAVAQCPIRIGEACSLCVPGATGPADCPLVWEVMHDDDLRARLTEMRREADRGPDRDRSGALP